MLIRNIGFFFFSLANTACITVFPQIFFNLHVYETRSVWLSFTLFLGAICSVIGIKISEKFGLGANPRKSAILLCVFVTFFMLVCGANWISSPINFLLGQCALCFTANFLTQELDVRSVFLVGMKARVKNDLIITACRFLGMLGAPLLFSWITPGSNHAIYLILVMSLLGFLSSYLLTGNAKIFNQDQEAMIYPPETGLENLLEFSSMLIYASYCFLAASIGHILSDIQNFKDADSRGLTLISTVYAFAFIGSVILGMTKRKPSLNWMFVAPLVLLFIGVSFKTNFGAEWSSQLIGATFLGFGFSLFLMAYRNRLSSRALKENRPELIGKYNSLPRYSALLGFSIMAIVSGLGKIIHQNFAELIVLSQIFCSCLILVGILYVVIKDSSGQNFEAD